MKMMAGAFSLASENRLLTSFSLSPSHLDTRSEEETEKKVESASVATACEGRRGRGDTRQLGGRRRRRLETSWAELGRSGAASLPEHRRPLRNACAPPARLVPPTCKAAGRAAASARSRRCSPPCVAQSPVAGPRLAPTLARYDLPVPGGP